MAQLCLDQAIHLPDVAPASHCRMPAVCTAMKRLAAFRAFRIDSQGPALCSQTCAA